MDQGPIGREREIWEKIVFRREKQKEISYEKINPDPYAYTKRTAGRIATTPTLRSIPAGPAPCTPQAPACCLLDHSHSAVALTHGANARRRFRRARCGNRPAPHLNLSAKPIAMSHQIPSYTGLQQQIHHDPPLWTPIVISPSHPFLFTLAALGCLFVGLWFGVSTHHAPPPSYPYYDTQKPVPPWSEPAPLKGNHDRGGE
jgi:hypothetical protein